MRIPVSIRAAVLTLGLSSALLVLPAFAQFRIGQQIPSLHFGKVVRGDEDVPVAGHALLIEFWATTCAPCIAQIPHLNTLVKQFRSRGLDFVSLTCEDPDRVKFSLRKHPMEGTVAIDTACDISTRFGGPGLPTTILVDSARRIAAVTFPSNVNSEVLGALIAHTDLPLSAAQLNVYSSIVVRAPSSEVDADARLVIRRVEQGGYSSWGAGQFDSKGSTLRDLLGVANEI